MARAWIGTSGFNYREWKPGFYPPELPEKQFLGYYAGTFDSVEIDYTFYRMPNVKTLEAWKDATPGQFRFALKASRKITHQQRLQVPSEALGYLMRVLPHLGDRLGMLLCQLPPLFRLDLERLDRFLNTVPKTCPTSVEFRHESWFSEEVYRVLERHNAALCINDGDDKTTPIRITANRCYVRLRRSEYLPEQRAEWQERFRQWIDQGVDVFAYVKHEDNPNAPAVARQFMDGI